MTQQLSSLLVTAAYDSTAFVSGMSAQVRAAKEGADSALQLARALAQADNANAGSSKGLVSLSRAYVDGYSNASRFESQIVRLTNAAAKDQEVASRSGAIYEGLVRKFGLLADASSVLARGQPAVAAAIEQVNTKLTTATASAAGYQAVIERVAAANAKVNAAPASAQVQQTVNRFAGVDRAAATDNGASFVALEDRAKHEAAAIDILVGKYAPLLAAERQHTQAIKEINGLAAEKHISPEEQTTAIARANVTYQAQAYAVKQSDEALKKMGATTGLTAYQMQNLGFQVNDVLTGLASGQPVMQIATQQMGQIVQILQSGGSVSGALESVKNKFLEIATVGRLAFGATVAAAAFATNAVSKYTTSLNELQTVTTGLGRISGQTVGALNNIAQSSAGVGRVSADSAREMVGSFLQAGDIGTKNFGSLIRIMRDYAHTTGQEIPEATKELSKDIANLADGGIERLNARLNVFDAGTSKRIQSLINEGKEFEAQAVAIAKISPVLAKQSESQGYVAKGWDLIKIGYHAFENDIGGGIKNFFSPDALKDFEKANKELANLKAAIASNDIVGGTRAQLPAAQAKAEAAGLALVQSAVKAADAADEARAIKRSNRAVEIIKDVYSEIAAYDQLTKQISELNRALDDPQARKALSQTTTGVSGAREARNALVNRREALRADALPGDPVGSAINRGIEDVGQRAAALNAVTLEARKAAAAESAWSAEMKKSGDSNLALAKAVFARVDVQQQLNAETTQAAAAQQVYLSYGDRLIEAAQKQGNAGIALRAQLEKEIEIRGGDMKRALTDEEQARAKAAGAAAKQANVIQDVTRAVQIERQGRGQVDLINLETQLLGANADTRERLLALKRADIAARAEEDAGQQKSADLIRKWADAVDEATRRQNALNAARQAGVQIPQTPQQVAAGNASVPNATLAAGAAAGYAQQQKQDFAIDFATAELTRLGREAANTSAQFAHLRRADANMAANMENFYKNVIAAPPPPSATMPQSWNDNRQGGAMQLVPGWLAESVKKEFNTLGEWFLSTTAGNSPQQRGGLSQAPLALFRPSAEGIEYARQQKIAPELASLQAQLQYAQNGGAGDPIVSPLTSLIEQLTSKVESESKSSKTGTNAATNAAPKTSGETGTPDVPNPYLERASNYFYNPNGDPFKETSLADIGKETLDVSKDTLDVNQDELFTARSQLESLKALLQSAQSMASNTNPTAVAAAIADGLRNSGFAQEAAEVLRQAQVYSLQQTIDALQKAPTTGGATSGTTLTKTASTTPTFGQTAFVPHIGSFASGTDGYVPVPMPDRLYTIGLTPGEEFSVRQRGQRSDNKPTVITNNYNNIGTPTIIVPNGSVREAKKSMSEWSYAAEQTLRQRA